MKTSNLTKLTIIQKATELFLREGFSRTTAARLCKELGISTGNLTFYFPTKEHVLDVLVEMLCEFQWQMMEEHANEGQSSLLAYCLELATMAAICEESETMRDFYLSTYTLPMTLQTIRANDLEKTKRVFRPFHPDWSEEQFLEAETLVSGIEYATLMTTEPCAELDERVRGALNAVMLLYDVPAEVRRTKIGKILSMDYRAVGKQIKDAFLRFTEVTTEHAIEAKLAAKKKKHAKK